MYTSDSTEITELWIIPVFDLGPLIQTSYSSIDDLLNAIAAAARVKNEEQMRRWCQSIQRCSSVRVELAKWQGNALYTVVVLSISHFRDSDRGGAECKLNIPDLQNARDFLDAEDDDVSEGVLRDFEDTLPVVIELKPDDNETVRERALKPAWLDGKLAKKGLQLSDIKIKSLRFGRLTLNGIEEDQERAWLSLNTTPPMLTQWIDWVSTNVHGAFENPLRSGTTIAKPALKVSADDLFGASLLSRLQFDEELKIDSVRHELSEKGLEALGWFQSYHEYDSESWGIYVDTEKVFAIGSELRSELRDAGCPSPNDGCEIILQLIVSHEMFHAQIETFCLSLELLQSVAKYRPNSRAVYKQQLGTSLWYEEALANYTARREIIAQLRKKKMDCGWSDKHVDVAISFIEQLFDLSPPGYRDWRLGECTETWRKLSNEAQSGLADPSHNLVPLEGQLQGLPKCVFQRALIPVFLTLDGNIGDLLLAPPRRRDVEKILLQLGYIPKGGKGSHQKWVALDQRHFTLPHKGELSPGVFSSLLKHLQMNRRNFFEAIKT